MLYGLPCPCWSTSYWCSWSAFGWAGWLGPTMPKRQRFHSPTAFIGAATSACTINSTAGRRGGSPMTVGSLVPPQLQAERISIRIADKVSDLILLSIFISSFVPCWFMKLTISILQHKVLYIAAGELSDWSISCSCIFLRLDRKNKIQRVNTTIPKLPNVTAIWSSGQANASWA